jgi:hypothetical protein
VLPQSGNRTAGSLIESYCSRGPLGNIDRPFGRNFGHINRHDTNNRLWTNVHTRVVDKIVRGWRA